MRVASSMRMVVAIAMSITALAVPAAAEQPWMVEACKQVVGNGAMTMKDCRKRIKAGADSFCSRAERSGYFDQPDAMFKNKHQCMSWYQKTNRGRN